MATAAIPPALVAELIDDVGAYAGIAAIVGLAVLSLLYFTQAREVKRLREWVGRAPDRDAELSARVRAEAMRQRTSAAPPAPGVRRPAGNGQQAPRPVQPPGVPAAPTPAPASQSAPASGEAPTGPPAAHPASSTASEGQPPPTGQAVQPPAQSPTGRPPGQGGPADQPPAGVPAPATAAASPSSPERTFAQARGATPVGGAPPTQGAGAPAGDQDTDDRQAVRAAAAGGRGGATDSSGQRAAALRRTDASARAVPPRAPRPRTPPPPPPVAGNGAGGGFGGRMIALVVAGGLLALVVGVLLITQVFGGDDDAQQAAAPSNSTPPAQTPPEDEGPPPRGEVNVAVLNGTTVNGLAETVADEVAESGFQRGETATNSDQTLSATTIEFAEGTRESALEVAEVLGVDEEAVAPLERNTRVTAGEEAAVIVIVGNDGVGNPAGADGGGGTSEGTGTTEGTGDAATP
jgi:hypothetical protein